MRILLVEDDPPIAETLSELLGGTYEVAVASTGTQALEMAAARAYHLIVLDLGLPDIPGVDVCRKLRRTHYKAPIIILTGESADTRIVEALDSGADDYVIKPFKFPELSARIRSALRRSGNDLAKDILTYGKLVLDPAERTVRIDDVPVILRRKEFDLLEYLLRNQGRILTRTMILDNVWDEGTHRFSNVVDVLVNYLRVRIERPHSLRLIKTVHGLGYTVPLL